VKLKLVSHGVLMDESWSHVGEVAESGHPHQQQIASRVLDDTSRWRVWEAEHGGFMQRISSQSVVDDQITALRRVSFAMIHRKALFEYLRANAGAGNGAGRSPGDGAGSNRARSHRLVLALFYDRRDPANALLSEHNAYLRSSCSHWCATHLGAQLMSDGIFLHPLEEYEELYSEYFHSFIRCALCRTPHPVIDEERLMLPHLKYRVDQLRRSILAAPRIHPEMMDEAQLRRVTGDTLRLPPPPDVQFAYN
jgi:hypothetical protein